MMGKTKARTPKESATQSYFARIPRSDRNRPDAMKNARSDSNTEPGNLRVVCGAEILVQIKARHGAKSGM